MFIGSSVNKSLLILYFVLLSSCSFAHSGSAWLLIDDFEQQKLVGWRNVDTQNDTNPYIPNPQVTEIRERQGNHYLIKKPAAEGVVGNRKALTFKALPKVVEVGQTYTFYIRVLVEHFPNNHVFGLSNLTPKEIINEGYNAFEPTLRVTDKYESNGFKNDGTLMVKIDSDDKYRQYSNIQNYQAKRSAEPMQTSFWYQIWFVVNNATQDKGGQTYDVFLQGGEFNNQTLVYKKASFRMKRERPLLYFFANSNTGSHKAPYGNGGLAYDDIYMSEGVNLTYPIQ